MAKCTPAPNVGQDVWRYEVCVFGSNRMSGRVCVCDSIFAMQLDTLSELGCAAPALPHRHTREKRMTSSPLVMGFVFRLRKIWNERATRKTKWEIGRNVPPQYYIHALAPCTHKSRWFTPFFSCLFSRHWCERFHGATQPLKSARASIHIKIRDQSSWSIHFLFVPFARSPTIYGIFAKLKRCRESALRPCYDWLSVREYKIHR